MASEYRRLLDTQSVSGAKSQEREQIFDAGAYTELNVVFYVLKLGTDSTTALDIKLQHAAINEEEAFTDLKDDAGNAVALDIEATGGSLGNKFFYIRRYLRYVRWVVTAGGTVTDAAVVGCDIMAKE